MPARSFGPYSSDGIPVRAGAKVQLRVKQTSGDPQQLAKLRFGIAQLEPKGSGGLLLPAPGPSVEPSPAPEFVEGAWIAQGATSDELTLIVAEDGVAQDISRTLPGTVLEVAWSQDGRWLACAHHNAPGLTVIDLETGDIDTDWPSVPGDGHSLAFSQDGSKLAVGHNTSPYLTVIDVATKAAETGWPDVSGIPRAVVWSLNDERIFLGGSSGGVNLTVVNTNTKDIESGWPTMEVTIESMALRPDGAKLAMGTPKSSSNHGAFRIMDLATGDLDSGWLTAAEALADTGYSIAWAPDADKLAVGQFWDGYRVIDVATQSVETGWASGGQRGEGIAWHPTEPLLAIAGQTAPGLRVVNTDTKTEAVGWPPGTTNGRTVAFAWDPTNTWSG